MVLQKWNQQEILPLSCHEMSLVSSSPMLFSVTLVWVLFVVSSCDGYQQMVVLQSRMLVTHRYPNTISTFTSKSFFDPIHMRTKRKGIRVLLNYIWVSHFWCFFCSHDESVLAGDCRLPATVGQSRRTRSWNTHLCQFSSKKKRKLSRYSFAVPCNKICHNCDIPFHWRITHTTVAINNNLYVKGLSAQLNRMSFYFINDRQWLLYRTSTLPPTV